MKRQDLEKLLTNAMETVVPTDINRHEETLQFFVDEAGKLAPDKAALFAYTHAVDTCQEMIRAVVKALYEEKNLLED